MADLPTVPYNPATQDLGLTPKRPPEDLQLDRHIRRITFYVVIAALLAGAAGAAYVAFLVPGMDEPAKSWARGVLSAIIGGVVGFAFAKK